MCSLRFDAIVFAGQQTKDKVHDSILLSEDPTNTITQTQNEHKTNKQTNKQTTRS